MSATVKIDVSDIARFQDEFKKRVARSQHSLAYNTNRTAFYLAKHAQEHTPVADLNKIEQLGVSGYKVFYRKKTADGKPVKLSRPKPIYSYGGRARDIWVGGYRNRHGGALPPELFTSKKAKREFAFLKGLEKGVQKGIREKLKGAGGKNGYKKTFSYAKFRRKLEAARDTSQAAERKINAIITSRLRRRRFLQCGWYPAIIKFAQAISETPYKPEGLKLLKKENGDATVAKDGWSPTASIIHNALLEGPQSGRPYHQLVAAMQFAMRKVTQEMIDYQRKQLEKALAN